MATVTAERLIRIEIAARQGIGSRLQQQPLGAGAAAAQLLLELAQPLLHRRRRWLLFTGSFKAAAPTDHQMVPRRHQSLEQYITVLIAAAGITETTLLLQQMKPCAATGAREISAVETHQHDHLVGNRPHRLKRAHGERTAAMPETAAVHRKCFLQHLQSHGRIQLQGTGLSPLAPLIQGLGPALQLTAPRPAITEQVLQLTEQQRCPGLTGAGSAQLIEHAGQAIQQRPPAHKALGVEILMKRSGPSRGQPVLLRQHQTKQPAIQAPPQAVGLIATTLPGIQAPAETTSLQGSRQQHRLIGRQRLLSLQSRVGQQPLQASGIEAANRQLQQHQHRHR